MKKILLPLLFAPFFLQAQTPEPNFIEVYGEASTEVRADHLEFSVSYSDASQYSEDPFEDPGAARMNVSIETARKILLDLSKKHQAKAEPALGDKYSVVQEGDYTIETIFYTLTFDNLTNLDAFMVDLRNEKIFSGSLLKIGYSKEKDAKRELRKAALEDARAKAEELAAALGKKLGPATNIWEEDLPNALESQQAYYLGEGMETLPTPTFGGDPAKSLLHCELRVRFSFF